MNHSSLRRFLTPQGSGQTLSQPAQRCAHEAVVLPAAADNLAPKRAQGGARTNSRPGPAGVLDLSSFLVHEMSAAYAQRDFGMVAQLHHGVGRVALPAAPALSSCGSTAAHSHYGVHQTTSSFRLSIRSSMRWGQIGRHRYADAIG
jgi:hypothetical protein